MAAINQSDRLYFVNAFAYKSTQLSLAHESFYNLTQEDDDDIDAVKISVKICVNIVYFITFSKLCKVCSEIQSDQ